MAAESSFEEKMPRSSPAHPPGVKLPELREFALKLGYSNQVIDQTVQTLGSDVSQNTFLKELLKTTSSERPVPHRMQLPPCNSQEYNRLNEQEHFMYQQILAAKKASGNSSSNLRPVVIDGSNVAMSHGRRRDLSSCQAIQLCVDWFKARGHKEITVFVPKLWRNEFHILDKLITDQEILSNLTSGGILVYAPSREVNGRRIVDRFIIKLAAETDGIVLSNDDFRDLKKENPKWKETIEQRLLAYAFVWDTFTVGPHGPLGRYGPSLDTLLQKGSYTHLRFCPYSKKCTFGLRCKFYHPERDQEAMNLKD